MTTTLIEVEETTLTQQSDVFPHKCFNKPEHTSFHMTLPWSLCPLPILMTWQSGASFTNWWVITSPGSHFRSGHPGMPSLCRDHATQPGIGYPKMKHVGNKYSLLMHGIKFESFAKFIFECKTFNYMWVYLFAINVFFEHKGYLIIYHGYATKDFTWLYGALDGRWKIIHMYEYMYELLILGLPHISDVDRTFAMVVQYMVTGVKFGNTIPFLTKE